MNSQINFGRLITAMITPFNQDGSINLGLAVEVAEYLIENKTTSIVLAGTTGESPTLTHDEEHQLFEAVIKGVKGKAKIMVGTGSNCTRTAIEQTQNAEKLGADASLQVVPYYNRPSQEGLFQHFSTIAQNTKLPIMIYNIPGRTACNMTPETMARLAQISNIVGVKEAAGDIAQVAKIRDLCPDDFLIYCGDDGLVLPFMQNGAHGVVSVASYIIGKPIDAMMTAFLEGNIEIAKEFESQLAPLVEALFMTTNPTPVKAAMKMIGFQVGLPRLPLVDLTEDEFKVLESELDKILDPK